MSSSVGLDLYELWRIFNHFVRYHTASKYSIKTLIFFLFIAFAFAWCVLMYFKGIFAPSTSDSGKTGFGFVWVRGFNEHRFRQLIWSFQDFWWGTELHPTLFGYTVKQLVNCRYGVSRQQRLFFISFDILLIFRWPAGKCWIGRRLHFNTKCMAKLAWVCLSVRCCNLSICSKFLLFAFTNSRWWMFGQQILSLGARLFQLNGHSTRPLRLLHLLGHHELGAWLYVGHIHYKCRYTQNCSVSVCLPGDGNGVTTRLLHSARGDFVVCRWLQ